MLLLKRNGTVTICHSKTANLPAVVKEADIVVVAMGRALSVGKDSFKAGQYVVDVGVNPNPVPKPATEDKTWKSTVGDVKFNEVEPIVAGISPVPGGVGSVTNAILVSHVVEAAKKA
jgi:methylenetetrahydrofolate dehydrogenase (NADP+)/methenyltetrahydrofolate cyclohydrolase